MRCYKSAACTTKLKSQLTELIDIDNKRTQILLKQADVHDFHSLNVSRIFKVVYCILASCITVRASAKNTVEAPVHRQIP